MKATLTTVLLFIGFAYANAQVKTYEAEGNLESPKPLDCVCISEVSNTNNPADILTGMAKCIEAGEYKKAADLFAIAGVYGKFDTYRVKDKSAHQALLVLQQNAIVNFDDAQKESLMKALQSELERGSDNLTEICTAIRKIGIPAYYPKYMIQHGLNAFIKTEGAEKEDEGLVTDFNATESWEAALNAYLHCNE